MLSPPGISSSIYRRSELRFFPSRWYDLLTVSILHWYNILFLIHFFLMPISDSIFQSIKNSQMQNERQTSNCCSNSNQPTTVKHTIFGFLIPNALKTHLISNNFIFLQYGWFLTWEMAKKMKYKYYPIFFYLKTAIAANFFSPKSFIDFINHRNKIR